MLKCLKHSEATQLAATRKGPCAMFLAISTNKCDDNVYDDDDDGDDDDDDDNKCFQRQIAKKLRISRPTLPKNKIRCLFYLRVINFFIQ